MNELIAVMTQMSFSVYVGRSPRKIDHNIKVTSPLQFGEYIE